jgi:hypothetical protein
MITTSTSRLLFKVGSLQVFELTAASYIPKERVYHQYVWRDNRMQAHQGTFPTLYECMENYGNNLQAYLMGSKVPLNAQKPLSVVEDNVIQVSFRDKKRIK